jgi:hypothetical protein
MRKLYLSLGLVSLLCLYTACGSSNGVVTGFIPSGNFSNASLNGQYVYQIEGFDFRNSTTGVPYREAGVFTANGSGGITSATDDFSEGSTVLPTTSTGSYAISKDVLEVELQQCFGDDQLAVTIVSAWLSGRRRSGSQRGRTGGKADAIVIATAPAALFSEHDINAVIRGQCGRLTVSANGQRWKQGCEQRRGPHLTHVYRRLV